MSTSTTSRLRELSLVCVPVTDQERSIAFYESLGLEKRTDVPMGNGYRWVEVYPPQGTTGIALAPPPPGREVSATETGIIINTEDIDAAHEEMRNKNVDVDAEVSRMGDPVPPMFWFRDPDGHSLMVVEPSR